MGRLICIDGDGRGQFLATLDMDDKKINYWVASTAFVVLAVGAVVPFLSTWNASVNRVWPLWLAGPYVGLMPAAVMSSQDRQASTVVLCGALLTAGPMMLLTWASAPEPVRHILLDGQAGLGAAVVGIMLLVASLAQWAGVFIVGLSTRQSLPAESRSGTLGWVLAAPLTILVLLGTVGSWVLLNQTGY
jgi:hypothetical protein